MIHMIIVDELPFRIVKGEGGENIGQALEKYIRDWGIERIFTITVDNAYCVKHAFVSIERVRVVVRYIRASPSRIKKTMHTRWNLTFMMLKVSAKYERAFDSVPTFDDRENVRRVEKVLKPFYDLTLKSKIPCSCTNDLWFFSTPILTVASKSAFSMSGHVLYGFRSSLTPTMVEALIFTQDWLRKSKDPINLDEYTAKLQNMENGKNKVIGYQILASFLTLDFKIKLSK
ncbi:hypothetical protein GQ457_05G025530 [Hibiscus cannabinus]